MIILASIIIILEIYNIMEEQKEIQFVKLLEEFIEE